MNQDEKMFNNKAEDLANNNHISGMQNKINALSLSHPTDFMFDSNLLKQIKPESFKFQYDKYELVEDSVKNECYVDLGDGLALRPLKRDDYEKEYMKLLEQLTEVGKVTKEDYIKRFDEMKSAPNAYYICVVEDLNAKKIVASLTLVYEMKFFRSTSARGRIEDMVVDSAYRGKKLSKILLDFHTQLSQILGCYKISLECKDHLKKHYEQFDFVTEQAQNYLCRRFVPK